MKYVKLSDIEYEFMEFAWSSRRALNLQDFKDHFVDKDWSPKSISFFLHRINKKGFLTSCRKGRVFYYTPTISHIEYQRYLLNERLTNKMGNSIEDIVASFCGIDEANEEELAQINKYLTRLSEKLNKLE